MKTVLILSSNLSVLTKIKVSGIVKLVFVNYLGLSGGGNKSFTKTVEKPPESPSTSGSINTAGNVISRDDLDSGDEELVNILHDMHKSQGVLSPKSINGRMKVY